MLKKFLSEQYCLNDFIKNSNKRIDQVVGNYNFYHISKKLDFDQNEIIYQNFKDSQIIIVGYYENINDKTEGKYLIISFKGTIIIIQSSSLHLLTDLFNCNSNLNICFLANSKFIFNENIQINYKETEIDQVFQYEMTNMTTKIYFQQKKKTPIKKIYNIMKYCISCYLIKQGYYKSSKNRFQEYHCIEKDIVTAKTLTKDEYIELRSIGNGSLFTAILVYHIKSEELCALKRPMAIDEEIQKLFDREVNNYKKLNQHPLFPRFIGAVENQQSLLIEFIGGQSLQEIKYIHLNQQEKMTIIFQLMLALEFLHRNHFIFRDLKPNNVMIDVNKNAVLIDFDRMISEDDKRDQESITKEFTIIYSAPESRYGGFTLKSDIFSLGQMIYYIINEEDPKVNLSNELNLASPIKEMYLKCTKKNPKERPTIAELLIDYYINFNSMIQIGNFFEKNEEYFAKLYGHTLIHTLERIEKDANDPNALYDIANLYYKSIFVPFDICKAIHYFSLAANQNHSESLYTLGCFYYNEKYVPRDINKAIHYFILASCNNHSESQYQIGYIYDVGKYVQQDIKKAIQYYSLASNQNHFKAQFNLGIIFYENQYVPRDINKAIHYFTLSANLCLANAQFYLGLIYYEGRYVPRDINKAIHYFLLAANQSYEDAQCYLGLIYYQNIYVPTDIDKALQYFSQASSKNHYVAQFYLGLIYYEGKYVPRNINKSMNYFALAANLNYPKAQNCLGIIYYEGKFVKQDISKSIHYFTLAANHNNAESQYFLGIIYYEGKFVKQDISKSIYYFTLAANQNNAELQYFLGIIYYEGKYVERSIKQAINHFTNASKLNHPYAQLLLGHIYFIGTEESFDINKAIKYLELAAKHNIAQAQHYIGFIYSSKYVSTDAGKAIYNFKLAADQNYVESQFYLGLIYFYGQIVPRDIKKAIYYFQLAAKQKYPRALFNLGMIFHFGEYVERDIKLGIHYYELASNLNDVSSQFNLGIIYSQGKYISRDINKAIHYYTLAANQNFVDAQFNLGMLYIKDEFVPRDIYKSFKYFEEAANKNHPQSQFILGVIYSGYFGNTFTKDIQKSINYFKQAADNHIVAAFHNLGVIYLNIDLNEAIHYFSLAVKMNYTESQLTLGHFYSDHDINKSIEYHNLAALNKNSNAQLFLGLIYLEGLKVPRNVEKGKYWIQESVNNGNKNACHILGFLYHEGKHFKQDILKAINYYKIASNRGVISAKNNLGVIYKNGFDSVVKKDIGKAIEYFNEAIKAKNDSLSMYNLANIYFYEESVLADDKKTVELLINSSKNDFLYPIELLCLFLIKKFGLNIEYFKEKIIKDYNIEYKMFNKVKQMIFNQKLQTKSVFESKYEHFRNINVIYNIFQNKTELNNLNSKECQKEITQYINEISNEFYEGFGYDLI